MQSYCDICDLDVAITVDGICAACWEAHATDGAGHPLPMELFIWAARNANEAEALEEASSAL